jgi:hypothetical protein
MSNGILSHALEGLGGAFFRARGNRTLGTPRELPLTPCPRFPVERMNKKLVFGEFLVTSEMGPILALSLFSDGVVKRNRYIFFWLC